MLFVSSCDGPIDDMVSYTVKRRSGVHFVRSLDDVVCLDALNNNTECNGKTALKRINNMCINGLLDIFNFLEDRCVCVSAVVDDEAPELCMLSLSD